MVLADEKFITPTIPRVRTEEERRDRIRGERDRALIPPPFGRATRRPGAAPLRAFLPRRLPPRPERELEVAVERIVSRWRHGRAEDERGCESEFVEQLEHVRDAVVSAVAGESVGDLDECIVLRRRLLELLRSELVSIWSETGDHPAHPPDPRGMTRTLRALDEVQERLTPRWDEEFGVALEGPSGLELATEVAHDFRSPLSSVLFLADTLRAGGSGELNDLQRRQLNLIYSAALSMVSMAGDVVDLSRGGVAITEREPTRFRVSEVMESVRGMVEPMAEAKGLALAVRPPDGDLRLGHPEGLQRVLLNLTTNAAKFTSEGFIELRARNHSENRVEFSVRDTGPGIGHDGGNGSGDDLYLPFPAFQGHSGAHFSGTGLGLTIARKLVRAMDGELEYETQRNLGTRFYFTIPLPRVEPL